MPDVSMALSLAALVYLAAYGARTPLLALRGLLRLRNIALVLAPAVLIGGLVYALQGRVEERIAAGAVAVAIAPAPLVGPGIVARMRGRMDLAGALALGTVILAIILVSGRGALASSALFIATEAYAIALMVAGALPPLRDALLVPLRIIGWLAFAIALAAGAVGASDSGPLGAPPIDAITVLVALALLVVGVGAAIGTAYLTEREPLASVVGAGLRDPALAVALATVASGAGATGVPLTYAVFCLVLAGLARLIR